MSQITRRAREIYQRLGLGTIGEPKTFGAVIDGETRPAGETFDAIDPSTSYRFARVARCGHEDSQQAVDSARACYESVWRRTTAAKRADVLRRVGAQLRTQRESLAVLECTDTGKPLGQALADIDIGARYFDFYANVAEALEGSVLPSPTDHFYYTLREPYGVTVHLIPWNYPIRIACRSAVPSLAAGNCCVIKPSERAGVTVTRLAEIALEAGLPPGALNVVTGLGAEVGEQLVRNRDVGFIAFTGSEPNGHQVLKSAAAGGTPVRLELGGKASQIVLDDAEIGAVAEAVINSIRSNAGQTCSTGMRLLVHEAAHDALVQSVTRLLQAITIGPALDDPELGPLIDKGQLNRVTEYCSAASQDGSLLYGGRPIADPSLPGYFFMPTLVDDLDPNSSAFHEPVFGPVVGITRVTDVQAAVELVNSAPDGLVCGVWTRNLGVAHRVARDVRVGQVYINTGGAGGGVEQPFGGTRRSGFGREKGFEAMVSYTQTKSVAVRIGPG